MNHLTRMAKRGIFAQLYDNKEEFLTFMLREFGSSLLFDLHKRYVERYGLPECGRNRATYLARTFVVKIPINWYGFADNDWEGSLVSCPDMELARTRLYYKRDIPILLMERVQAFLSNEQIRQLNDKQRLTYDSSDCGQVGFTRKNKLVCFDYGYR